MAAASTTLLLPTTLLLLLLAASPRGGARAAPDTTARSVLCNGATYGAGDPFAASLAYVLSELLSSTTPAGHGDGGFYNISPYPTAFAYGHASCRAALSTTAADCASCLASAASQMRAACGRSVGARAVLVDCAVRYEQYPFAE